MIRELIDAWDRLLGQRGALLQNIGLLLLRVSLAGSMVLGHGLSKIQNYDLLTTKFPDPIGLGSEISLLLAIFSEVICSVLVVFGAVTRLALIPLIVTMAVAFFIVHGSDPFGEKELSFVYLIVFSGLLLTGPGQFSVDRWCYKKCRA